jgi:hypothetical protein
MSILISQGNLIILIRLLISHFIAHFVFQINSYANTQSKKKWISKWLYLQGVLAGILTYILVGIWTAWYLPLIIFISYVLIDGFISNHKDNVRWFLLDQLIHLSVILGLWILLTDINIMSLIKVCGPLKSNVKLWVLILSFVIVLWPSSTLIEKIIEPWRKKEFSGLEKAGLWIGCLERILILIFVLLDQFEAIGFLIAAKSIFRFGELTSKKSREEAEYILIGTMISFVIAIALGLCMRLVFQHL